MEPTPETWRGEIDALRRSLRWLTAVCTFLGLGLVLTLVQRLAGPGPALAARQFVLLDAHGQRRGEFSCWADGSPVLQLDGRDGRERVLLVARDDGSAAVRLTDAQREKRLCLELLGDGSPLVLLTDQDGRALARLSAGAAGMPRLVLEGRGGIHHWEAP